jgi:hypothetical protein
MKHFDEEELIDYYYGESAAATEIARHLRVCARCEREYAALSRDLSEIASTALPVRDAAYGEQVWQSIRASVPVYEVKNKQGLSWLRLNPFGGFAAVAAALLIVVAVAFFAGRQWEQRNPQAPIAINGTGAGDQGKQRVVLVVLGDHLDRSERLLVQLRHAEPATEAPLQAEARDLLAANRLYRESVAKSDDPTLTAALDHLERVLIEVSNEPGGLTQARLDEFQKEMNTDGLLFEVRVLRSRVQSDVQESAEPKKASSSTKGVSI